MDLYFRQKYTLMSRLEGGGGVTIRHQINIYNRVFDRKLWESEKENLGN